MPWSALHPVLRQPIRNQPAQKQQADLIVGVAIETDPQENTIDFAKQIIYALRYYYPDLATTFIFTDTGYNSDIRQAIQTIDSFDVGIITARYTGLKGQGSAIGAILHEACQLSAKAIIILDGQSSQLESSWIPGFAKLILEQQIDLLKPRYALPLPESTLNDLLFYPFTRAVWGTAFERPAAPDFAISGRASQIILAQDVWETDISRAGFHIWLSTVAIMKKWRLAQTALRAKKDSPPQNSDIAITEFKEMVGTMLRQLHLHGQDWPAIRHCQPVPTLTEFAKPQQDTITVKHDEAKAIETLVLGWIEYRHLWEKILLPEHLIAVEYIASQPEDRFYFPPDLWAKVVYDFAVVYNKGELDPDAVVTALYPLYQGRVASFWPEIAGLTTVGRAGAISAQGVEFEDLKAYLCHRWNNFKPGV